MNTDWMFEKPIDSEHKEYKLLSYFQKMGDKLDKMELYPGFIELSLHIANAQTLIKDKKILYTDKKFKTVDDELLIRDLKVKNLPEMTPDEYTEFIKTLSYSTPRLIEYFNIAKSVWEVVFDDVSLKVRFNKKNELNDVGYFYYLTKQNDVYLWRYTIKSVLKNSPEKKIICDLMYSEQKNDLTINKIINMFASESDNKEKLPVFEMSTKGNFPIENTLLPLFKRRLISYVTQKKQTKEYYENKEKLKM